MPPKGGNGSEEHGRAAGVRLDAGQHTGLAAEDSLSLGLPLPVDAAAQRVEGYRVARRSAPEGMCRLLRCTCKIRHRPSSVFLSLAGVVRHEGQVQNDVRKRLREGLTREVGAPDRIPASLVDWPPCNQRRVVLHSLHAGNSLHRGPKGISLFNRRHAPP